MTMAVKAVVWNDISVNVGWGVLRGKTCVVGDSPFNPENGVHIVGIHGWLDNCNTFDPLVPLLPPNSKVLVLDLPGHGLSDHLPLGAHYNPVVYVLNVRTAVVKLGWKKFVLMGHSMGSAVANVFTALFPEHVMALISFDYVAPFTSDGFVDNCRTLAFDLIKAEQLAMEPPLVYSEKEAIDRLVSARIFGYSNEPNVDREAAQTLLPRSTKQVDDGYVWSHDQKARSTFLIFLSGSTWKEVISSIKCPVLIIQATRGTGIIPAELCGLILKMYRKYVPWFHTEMVDGSHHVHLTNPERVTPIVTNFLEKLVQGTIPRANL